MTSPSPPRAVPDAGAGPPPVPGRADELAPGLIRLTAPNPGLMTGPGTNTYVVGAGDGLAVVDPGPDDEGHRRAILATAAGRGSIRWVLTTHTHPDHAPGAAPLAREVGARLVGYEARDGFVPDIVAGDGWALEGAGFRLQAVHTPGHAGNHLCWLLEPGRILLSGDHVMHGATVVIRPPDGDMGAYLASLRRVGDLDLAAIAPGHGRLIGEPATVVEAIIAHRLEREAVVLRTLEASGGGTLDDLLPAVYADVAPTLLPVARASLWAHLRKLAAEGRARRTPPDGRAVSDPANEDDHPELSCRWLPAPAP